MQILICLSRNEDLSKNEDLSENQDLPKSKDLSENENLPKSEDLSENQDFSSLIIADFRVYFISEIQTLAKNKHEIKQ